MIEQNIVKKPTISKTSMRNNVYTRSSVMKT